jgi:hypothetical protein
MLPSEQVNASRVVGNADRHMPWRLRRHAHLAVSIRGKWGFSEVSGELCSPGDRQATG